MSPLEGSLGLDGEPTSVRFPAPLIGITVGSSNSWDTPPPLSRRCWIRVCRGRRLTLLRRPPLPVHNQSCPGHSHSSRIVIVPTQPPSATQQGRPININRVCFRPSRPPIHSLLPSATLRSFALLTKPSFDRVCVAECGRPALSSDHRLAHKPAPRR